MEAIDDPVARMRAAKHLSTSTFDGNTIGPVVVVSEANRDAVLDELEQLRDAANGMAFLRTAEAATVLKVTTRTLLRWRINGTGPAFVQEGHVVRYQMKQLMAWARVNHGNDGSAS